MIDLLLISNKLRCRRRVDSTDAILISVVIDMGCHLMWFVTWYHSSWCGHDHGIAIMKKEYDYYFNLVQTVNVQRILLFNTQVILHYFSKRNILNELIRYNPKGFFEYGSLSQTFAITKNNERLYYVSDIEIIFEWRFSVW